MKWRYILLFLAGILTEIIWILSVLSVKHDQWWIAAIVAFLAPYVALVTNVLSFVDETRWAYRIFNVTIYAAGDIAGLLISILVWPHISV